MPDDENGYDLAAISRLLLAAFAAGDLRRFCRDRPTFRPILGQLSPQFGLEEIVDRVIDYCDTHRLFDQLLDAVREERPAQYAHHEPFLRAPTADRIAVKVLKPGSTLLSGRYRIVRHIARGGFGSVYLAEDTLLREQVAIKELIPALVGDDAALKRFLVEGKATMQLAHPHIVRTRDLFEAEGNYYIVMEHMLARSLEDQIKARKMLPVDDAVRIVAEVCDGLAYAHAKGVVHCDLKPSNILLAADGSAKVGDFGVAHVSDQMITRSWITPGGFAGGTLPYMSPEQTDGVRDDPRVDVYALGAVLYRALTGRTYLDFDQRDTPRAQADNVQRICTVRPEPPSTYNRRIPAWLDAVVIKALAKQPDDRYAGVADLRSALLSPPSAPAVAPLPAPSLPPAPTPRPTLPRLPIRLPAWLWPAAAAAVLIVILGIAASLLQGGGQSEKKTPQVVGRTVVYVSAGPGPTYTAAPTPTLGPTVTPLGGGSYIAFASDRDGNQEIYVIYPPSDSYAEKVTENPADEDEPTWSPDGRWIAFTSNRDGNNEIYIVPVPWPGPQGYPDGSSAVNLTGNSADDGCPAWSPGAGAAPAATTTTSATPTPAPLGGGGRIAFHSNRDGNYEIYTMAADGSGRTRLTDNPADDKEPTWSPDGARIAFASDRDGNYEIYVMNADGSNAIRLTDNPADDREPAWSPDGRWIAFASNRDGNNEIYIMPAPGLQGEASAGGSNLVRLTSNLASDGAPDWSPDGTRITFASNRNGNDEVYMVNTDGSSAVNLTNNLASDGAPDWSP